MIDIDAKGLEAAIDALDPKQVEKAHVRATNAALRKGRTAWNKRTRQDYAIKAGDINKRSKLATVRRMAQNAGITLSGEVLPLKRFGARQTAKGVTVKIRKQGPRKLIKGAFGPKSDALNNHVFARSGDERLPIEKLMTVSVPQMADDRAIISDTLGVIEENYTKEFGRLLELFGSQL